jgi:cell division septal protein FtsQ
LVSGPIDDLNDPLKIMNFFNDYEKKFFNLKTIEYSYVSGWEVTTNSFVVKIGKQLSEKKFKSLRDTLNYLYENKRNPSMIDLRYKDGVALNYGE